jgi:hypothetical protein
MDIDLHLESFKHHHLRAVPAKYRHQVGRRAGDRWCWQCPCGWRGSRRALPPPRRSAPARGSNCMNAATMSPELHERGIHAVSCGAGGPGGAVGMRQAGLAGREVVAVSGGNLRQ